MSDTGRIDDYLDGMLSASEADAFAADAARDPELRRHLDLRQGALALLHQSQPEAPPRNFRWLVEKRIRRRLQRRMGRAGAVGLAAELVVAAVMVLVLAVCSVAMSPVFDPPAPASPVRVTLPEPLRLELAQLGAIESVGLDTQADGLIVRLVVPAADVDALRALVARRGLRASPSPDRFGRVEVFVPRR